MFTTVSTSLSTSTLTALLAHCELSGADLSATIVHAVEDWLARQSAAGQPEDMGAGVCRGYQWKTLYLPEGTLLRSWSYGECRDAQVIGGRIMHEGRSVSPNQFARSFARTVRNAWKDLRIRRPDDTAFHCASSLRRELAACAAAATPDKTAEEKADKKAGKKVAKAAKAAKTAGRAAGETAGTTAGRDAVTEWQHPGLNRNSGNDSALAPAPARAVTPGPRWDLPERRKLRYRLEDVAFD